MTAALVAVAGAAGVLARYGLGTWIASIWTVVAINVAGSFLLGVLAGLGGQLSADARTALGVGFLGGFTTFSTFSVQIVAEAEGGRPGRAAAYLAASVAGGVLAALAGHLLGRAAA